MIKKFVVIFFFLPLSCFAEWVEVTRSLEEPRNIVFIDFATATKKESFLRLWVLTNYGTPVLDNAVASSKVFEEIDCKELRSRRLQSIGYSDFDGKGKVIINRDAASQWSFATPGSVYMTVVKAACNYKK